MMNEWNKTQESQIFLYFFLSAINTVTLPYDKEITVMWENVYVNKELVIFLRKVTKKNGEKTNKKWPTDYVP